MRAATRCSSPVALSLAAITCACAADGRSRQSETAYNPTTTIADASSGDDSETTAITEPTDSGDPSSTTAASTTSSSTADADGSGTTDPTDPTAATLTSATTQSTGGASICDGIVGEELIPPVSCDGPSGNTSTEVPSNGLFSTSWFGCYLGADGEIVQDDADNCEFACGPMGLCDPGASGPQCEAGLQWFAADADRYGCGGRIRVTNCENGNAVVLVTLDRGPNCSVEMDCETPVLDMSHDAMVYLFDGNEFGGCEHQVVVVETVDDVTPLGPG